MQNGGIMAKSRKTLDERIRNCTSKEEEMLEKLKQYQAQRKQLEKRRKEEERKIRTRRLIQIGGAVELVLGRPVVEEEIPKLIAFLKKQESNGKYFSRAMQTEQNPQGKESSTQGRESL
jgi:CO dehydrogenase/acetyl-CoA synthase alpha subunit